jgi:hypothetical protein
MELAFDFAESPLHLSHQSQEFSPAARRNVIPQLQQNRASGNERPLNLFQRDAPRIFR